MYAFSEKPVVLIGRSLWCEVLQHIAVCAGFSFCLLCLHVPICQTEENVEPVECRPTLPTFVLVSCLQLFLGAIPPELGGLTALQTLSLRKNQLTGKGVP